MVRTAGRGREIQWRLPTPRHLKTLKVPPIDYPLEMITRAEWAAEPREEQESDLRLKFPIKHIRYTFTDTEQCADKDECIPFLRQLQKDTKTKGFPDLMYNFLIGSDGMLYEGCGFDWKCTVFADPWVNSPGESLNIAYIGKFHKVEAPWQFRLTSRKFQKWMLKHGILYEEFEVTPSICWPDDHDTVVHMNTTEPSYSHLVVTPLMRRLMGAPPLEDDQVYDNPGEEIHLDDLQRSSQGQNYQEFADEI